MSSFVAGLGLGLSLIVAIGAQNVFVLRQGIRRERVIAVILICALSDAVLIAAGIAGMGAAVEAVPWLIDAARWLGAAFLAGYAILAARRAWRPKGESLASAAPSVDQTPRGGTQTDTVVRTRLAPIALTALALTWLNPHVYLDTVFLLGSVGATYGDARWWFAAGAITGSLVWFSALGLGARHLGRWFSTVRAWRILDACVAVVMLAIAATLVLGG